jgi:hypothetical protein
MSTPALSLGPIEYRVALILHGSQMVLANAAAGSCYLPRVEIPRWTRPVQQLKTTIAVQWGLDVFILGTAATGEVSTPLVIAELLVPESTPDFQGVPLNQIFDSELSSQERSEIELLLEGRNESPLSSIGWMDQVLVWIESVTGHRFSSKKCIGQLNAGGGFALLRLRSDDDSHFWLKATGEPNRHELSVTLCLSRLCPDCLPELIGFKREWNAWLTEESGRPLGESPALASIIRSAHALAAMQIRTIDHVDELLASGAFDQRIPVLECHIDPIISYLIDAMERQTSTKVAPLSNRRLCELGTILRDACLCMASLGIPDTLLHNDLNAGNILDNGARCVFTDWSEAAVGNPFLAAERLCQLSAKDATSIRSAYREYRSEHLDESSIRKANRLAPLLAIFAYLYGRGEWFKDTGKIRPGFESYARSLARHMDRAAKNPLLLETLCH